MSGRHGPAMLRRMRHVGSRVRFLIVAADSADHVRAEAITAGAMACLAKPVEARILLNFLRSRTTGLAAQELLSELHEWADLHDEDVDQELMGRLHEMYLDALPDRLQAIASSTRSGNAPAVVSAAHTLAGTSGQLGHPDVAAVCQAIAADARRGVMAHARVVELQELARPDARSAPHHPRTGDGGPDAGARARRGSRARQGDARRRSAEPDGCPRDRRPVGDAVAYLADSPAVAGEVPPA